MRLVKRKKKKQEKNNKKSKLTIKGLLFLSTKIWHESTVNWTIFGFSLGEFESSISLVRFNRKCCDWEVLAPEDLARGDCIGVWEELLFEGFVVDVWVVVDLPGDTKILLVLLLLLFEEGPTGSIKIKKCCYRKALSVPINNKIHFFCFNKLSFELNDMRETCREFNLSFARATDFCIFFLLAVLERAIGEDGTKSSTIAYFKPSKKNLRASRNK